MAGWPLPDTFTRSYNAFESYPRDLIYQTSYPTALEAYTARLDNAEPILFTDQDEEVHVPFRDFTGQEFERRNILDDAALKRWLGDRSTIDPLTKTQVGELATKRDPKCRFVFIWGGHSRRSLRITRRMLVRILSYHQVMTSFLDFISVFGLSSESRELRFSGFHEQTTLATPTRGPAVPSLGRSGRQFQLCYNLKGVTCTSSPKTKLKLKEWPIRQAAFHHQFDVVEGTTLWIVVKGNLELKDRIQTMTGNDGRLEDRAFATPEESFKSSLAVHLLQFHWSTEEWRWYIQWLEDVMEEETRLAIEGPRGQNDARHEYTSENLQNVQRCEDRTNEAIMILEANADVIESVRKFYERLIENSDFPSRAACRGDVGEFGAQANDMMYDLRMQVVRAKVLVKITADRKNMILQHLQMQAAEKMEALTISMRRTGANSQREAIAMRIVTFVTLIYLPATFVSTFFSTDVIKYQNQNGGNSSDSNADTSNGSFSSVALIRWIEVTAPLTIVTIVVCIFYFIREDKKRKRDEALPFYTIDTKAFNI